MHKQHAGYGRANGASMNSCRCHVASGRRSGSERTRARRCTPAFGGSVSEADTACRHPRCRAASRTCAAPQRAAGSLRVSTFAAAGWPQAPRLRARLARRPCSSTSATLLSASPAPVAASDCDSAHNGTAWRSQDGIGFVTGGKVGTLRCVLWSALTDVQLMRHLPTRS